MILSKFFNMLTGAQGDWSDFHELTIYYLEQFLLTLIFKESKLPIAGKFTTQKETNFSVRFRLFFFQQKRKLCNSSTMINDEQRGKLSNSTMINDEP